jgi:hypothetical protein
VWQDARCRRAQGFPRTYSPSPFGRGRGEGQVEAGRALAGPMLPYADVKTAVSVRRASAWTRDTTTSNPSRKCAPAESNRISDADGNPH